MTKLTMIETSSIQKPIQQSPGFSKKELADYKLDLMGRCALLCSYCSSDTGRALMTRMPELLDAVEQKTSVRQSHLDDPTIVYSWPDVLVRLEQQLAKAPKGWGAGKTIILSMLTDPFSPPLTFPTYRSPIGLRVCEDIKEPIALARACAEERGKVFGREDEEALKGPPATLHALRLLIERTSFRIRILTKSAVVANDPYLELLKQHKDRVVVGLSIGTQDNAWARAIEKRAHNPTARIEALRTLQDAGVPTFGMLCPMFPDVLDEGKLEALVDAIRPDLCEHVWAEPYNDRGNWEAVRDAYPKGSGGYAWFERMFGGKGSEGWSSYATQLYQRLIVKARADGWLHKLRYLLYEGDITCRDAAPFSQLDGVLLQGKTEDDGYSSHPSFAVFEKATGAGRAKKGKVG
jgi:DNA repair photolyase